MSALTEALKAAQKVAAEKGKEVLKSQAAQALKQQAAEAVKGMAKDLTVDAIKGSEKMAADKLRASGHVGAATALDSAFDRNVSASLNRIKEQPVERLGVDGVVNTITEGSQITADITTSMSPEQLVAGSKAGNVPDSEIPLTEAQQKLVAKYKKSMDTTGMTDREMNEAMLGQLSAEHQNVARMTSFAKNTAEVASAVDSASSVAAVGIGATGVGAPVAGAVKAAGMVATGVGIAGNVVAGGAKRKADAIADLAANITKVPPKDDILMHFASMKEEYEKDCWLSDREFGKIPLNKKLAQYLSENAKRIGTVELDAIMTLYFAYSSVSVQGKEYIRAAYGYLTSNACMIPHAAKNIGFVDDKIVVQYVCERVGESVTPVHIANGKELAAGLRIAAGDPLAVNKIAKQVKDITPPRHQSTIPTTGVSSVDKRKLVQF